jgi:deoxycytidine triphosphate deaminase
LSLIVVITTSSGRFDTGFFGAILVCSVITLLLYVTKKSDVLKPTKKVTQGIYDAADAVAQSAKQAIADKAARDAQVRVFNAEKKAFIDSTNTKASSKSIEVVVLGGAGWDHLKDKKYLFSMDESFVCMGDLVSLVDTKIPMADLLNIDISGPGKVSGNAGITGGGFGLEGAAKGIAAATVINFLTSHSSTKTVIRLGFKKSEIVMLTSQIEPDAARILLSPLYLRLNQKPAPEPSIGLSGELQNLHKLKQDGAITEEEYDKLKRQLIG